MTPTYHADSVMDQHGYVLRSRCTCTSTTPGNTHFRLELVLIRSRGKTNLVGGALAVMARAGQDSDAAHTPACQGQHLHVQHVHGLRHMQPVKVDRSPLKYLRARSAVGRGESVLTTTSPASYFLVGRS